MARIDNPKKCSKWHKVTTTQASRQIFPLIFRGPPRGIASAFEKAVDAIRSAAQTGRIGDGKIFVSNIEEAVRIRTGESGIDAI